MNLIQNKGHKNISECTFLHGFLGTKEDWRDLWKFLSPHLFCYAIDLPGHGSAAAISKDYLEVLEREVRGSVLVGYSLGGRLALQLAARNPEAYSHVVILSAHPGLICAEEKRARLMHDQEWATLLKQSGIDTFLKQWYAQPLFRSLEKRPELLQQLLEKRKSQDPHQMADVLMQLSLGRQERIETFHPRTLFLYGDADEKYQKIYSALPKDITVRCIENSGHVVHMENPMRCAECILKWMEENS
jgi:2-succinyl-6-hydroxy-2,4-cyclohexadiene-1-carboxylate synthase